MDFKALIEDLLVSLFDSDTYDYSSVLYAFTR